MTNFLSFRLNVLISLLFCSVGSGQESPSTKWRQLPTPWPHTSNQVRSIAVSQNEVFVGVGGMVPQSAQVWKLTDSGWTKHAQLASLKVAALQADLNGNLYLGAGTPHSAEIAGQGQAEVWRVDPQGDKKRLLALPERDVVYSMVWHQNKLHIGTMTEDRPGTADIWRFDDPGWTRLAGTGIPGWPQDNSYAGTYELWVHNDALIAGTFSRTKGGGDVLSWKDGHWIDLQIPETIIVLSFVTYRGRLVAALSNLNSLHDNPIFELQPDGTWKPVGVAPAEWKPAHIFNHLVVHNDQLYVGVGGKRGTLSVWEYDGTNWQKLAGDGRNGSWNSPVVEKGHEWIYRMAVHKDKLLVGFASDSIPFSAPVWDLTLPSSKP